MAELIEEYTDYDPFARRWFADALAERGISLADARARDLLNEQETRHLWQLLGLLPDEELVIQLPAWLADEKVMDTERATPTLFVGRIARETDDAILFEDSAAADRLMRLAHRIHSLEQGLEQVEPETDRREWLETRIQETRTELADRGNYASLAEEWLPKSQIVIAVRRRE